MNTSVRMVFAAMGGLGISLLGYAGDEGLASLTVDHGVVSLRGIEASEFVPTKAVKPLGKNEVIRTGKESSAQIDFRDGTVVRLGADAELAVVERTVGERAKHTTLRLSQGQLRLRVDKALGDSTFKVTTPVAVCAVRGTVGTVEHDPMKRLTRQWTEEGIFANRSADPAVKGVIVTRAGEGCEIAAGQPPKGLQLPKGIAPVVPMGGPEVLDFSNVPGFSLLPDRLLPFRPQIGEPPAPGGGRTPGQPFHPNFGHFVYRDLQVKLPTGGGLVAEGGSPSDEPMLRGGTPDAGAGAGTGTGGSLLVPDTRLDRFQDGAVNPPYTEPSMP